MLQNYTETVVLQLLNSVLEDYKKNKNPNICTCERCRQDIMAIALNNLPPRYIATDTGEVITQVAFNQFGGRAEIITQLIKAIEKVNANPRH
ncbi:MAG: late competence development ComFB family protein [Desulfotomaculum sp.]|nr:late competence development ComFB family protein [Desulfotomaculum sp.]